MTATPLVGTSEAIAEIDSANRHLEAKRSLFGLVQMVILIEVVLIGFIAWVRDRSQKLLFWMLLFLGASILTLLTTPLDIPSLYRIQALVLWPVHCIEDISLWYLLLYLLDLNKQPSFWRWARILSTQIPDMSWHLGKPNLQRTWRPLILLLKAFLTEINAAMDGCCSKRRALPSCYDMLHVAFLTLQ